MLNKTIKPLLLTTFGILTYILFGASCLTKKSIVVNGHLFGYPIQTTVDSQLTKLMLSAPNDNKVLDLFDLYQDQSLDTKVLSEISTNYSLDVATLYFLQRACQSTINKQAQDQYAEYNQQL